MEMNYIAVVYSYRHKRTGAVGEDFLILQDELGIESSPIITEDSVYPSLLEQNLMKAGKYLMKAKGFTNVSYIACARCETKKQADEYLEKVRKLKEKITDFYEFSGCFDLEAAISSQEWIERADSESKRLAIEEGFEFVPLPPSSRKFCNLVKKS